MKTTDAPLACIFQQAHMFVANYRKDTSPLAVTRFASRGIAPWWKRQGFEGGCPGLGQWDVEISVTGADLHTGRASLDALVS